MGNVEKEMEELKEHTNSQLAKDKPLYLWQSYHGYSDLEQAIGSLTTAVANLEPVKLPECQTRVYRCRAREYSTAISTMAIFILGHMNTKCDTCIDEIEASNLDAKNKQEANSDITSQVGKLLKYCSHATSSTWEAFDRLEASLTTRATPDSPNTYDAVSATLETLRQDLLSQRDAQHAAAAAAASTTTTRNTPFSYLYSLPILLLLFLCYLYALSQQPHFPPTPTPDPLYTQTLQLVQRTHAVTNLTGALYSVQLAHLDTRYEALERSAESCGLRIDNLVDALGVPDEWGNYRAAVVAGAVAGVVPDGVARTVVQRVERMEGEVERRLKRLQGEMEQMRKNVNRMDIRLTKRMDGVAR